MPAITGTGQLFSKCAYLWAIPGCTLYLAPFGSVTISGVAGNLITFQNINIPNGQVIQAGTLMVMGPPAASSASQLQSQLDRLRGFLNGFDSFIVGAANQLLRWNVSGGNVFLQPVNGMIFIPNPSAATEISPEDVGGSGITTTPMPAALSLSAYYALPNLPAGNLLPATFYAHVLIRLSVSTNLPQPLVAKHNSADVAGLQNSTLNVTTVVLPVSGSRLQLELSKGTSASSTQYFARVRILGYSF